MECKKNLVSCVTPVYNGAQYLGEMLESVLGQTYPLIEMVLVNDGSDDGTLEVAESYKAGFAKKGYGFQIISVPHKNAAAALNQGLKFITGEYLIWPDSDDILEKDSVKRRVDFLTEHPEYKCVRSLMYYFDLNGTIPKAEEKLGDLKEERLFFDIMESHTFVCCGCYMLKTEEFFSVYPERRIPEYSVGQNFQMLLPYMYHYPCRTIPEKLYGVRVHLDSDSRKKRTRKEEKERLRYFETLIDDIAEICHITSFYERRRILCWKLGRRRSNARRYGEKLKEEWYHFLLFLCGRSRMHKALFDFIRLWKCGRMK